VKIEALGLHKRYGRQFVVREFFHVFESGSRSAIAGPNGSGKSTLVRMLSGQLMPSAGELRFSESEIRIAPDDMARRVALCAPYVELIEELTGEEALQLHANLRGFRQNITPNDIWAKLGWHKRTQKNPVRTYSSGMRQRIMLCLALASDAGAVLLDEPTSNLDAEGVAWYRELLRAWLDNRTLIVASNEERDFVDCKSRIEHTQWGIHG